ncbi:alanine/glycine:cation symporter family protein [Streptomyces sp. DSM 42041]|uniref:Alanine/glycine:cation symporter family protein n=1 Tax=Streptomyces hazeniae TaxID=3075538 RepID=A0ABU2NQH7_9ACTN|nr:alanine/glycine:cation symporter family protein [Streptomyces sp. DSM 42041]MDT0377868.1 alanine/glycine:cation symporter family protein [Streptomyces sp. DSM 42041]
MANTDSSFLESVDKAISDFTEPIATWMAEVVFYEVHLFGHDFPWIVAWLVVAGLVFTTYFGFAQLRHLKVAFRLVRGKYEQKDAPGEVSHFQALTSAVSGTVGLGNIAGVAIAVTIGGAGATFWMILCGLLGMATKFVECTLGVKYREIHADGTVSGGPMHYLRKGMAERGFAGVGKVLAVGSAVSLLFFTFFGGNLFQVNQSLEQLQSVTGKDDSVFTSSGGAFFFGLLIAAVVALVLIGGMKSIGAVTSKLVPSMALLYVTACAIVIAFNITAVPDAFGEIFQGAFSPEGVVGGIIGAIIQGFRRAAFSNEAGIGSAPIAHSAVKTKRPATEGLVAMLEPFLDTVFICTMTALTIIIAQPQSFLDAREKAATGAAPESGVALTSDAFETVIPWFPYVLTVAVLLFAISTIITWSYYGLKAWTYLFGRSRASELIYKIFFCTIVVSGALMSLGSLVTMADSFLFLAAVFNIIGLYFLAPVVKRELRRVLEYVRRRDAGETDEQIEASEPRDSVPGQGGPGLAGATSV